MDVKRPPESHREAPGGRPAAVGASGDRGARASGAPGAATRDAVLEEPLRARLERVVALVSGGRQPESHGELLDELRALVREAEALPPVVERAHEEVVERPARRLHGT